MSLGTIILVALPSAAAVKASSAFKRMTASSAFASLIARRPSAVASWTARIAAALPSATLISCSFCASAARIVACLFASASKTLDSF